MAKAIQPIVDEPEMLRQFALAIITTLDEDAKSETKDLAQKIKNIIEPVRQDVLSVINGLSRCAGDVRKIPVVTKDVSSSFRVTGTTGITAEEARSKWTDARQQVSKSWTAMKKSQTTRANLLEQLSQESAGPGLHF